MTTGKALWDACAQPRKVERASASTLFEHIEQVYMAEQLVFELAAMGLVHCPSCGKVIEQAELHHLGECFDCFRASIEN